MLELQIDAAGTQYAASDTSQHAFETLIDGDQWMIYRNVKTNVLHWDFVSPLISDFPRKLKKVKERPPAVHLIPCH
jgi:hypothetical protein